MLIRKSTILIVLFALSNTACSTTSGPQGGAPNNGKLNPMSELLVGTLKLDGTPNAVTKQQAAELLPMWQVYQQIITSDTAAQAEIDGLTQQISDTMTADQRKAISDMKLSQSDIFAFMQQQGGGMQANGTPSASRTTTGQNNNQGGFPGGPGGGMPPGGMGDPGAFGGGMPGGGTTSQRASGTQTANSQANGARPGGMNRVPSVLIDSLIKYLQKVAAS